MGVNAALFKYINQQSEDMYDLMDKTGIITWAEIPFVGPGGDMMTKGLLIFQTFGKKW